MLNTDYKVVAQAVTDNLDVTVEAIAADPDDENAAYVLVYDAAKFGPRAYATYWVEIAGSGPKYGNHNLSQNEGMFDLIIRAGFPRGAGSAA